MDDLALRQRGGTVQFAVRVTPRAARDEIVGLYGEALKVRLAAAPVEGAANRALVVFLAEQLAVRPYQVTIVGGESSKNKVVAVTGVSAEEVYQHLQAKIRKD